MSKSLIERMRDHLACYWKEGDVAPQLTSIELMLIEEAANELAAAQAQRDKAVAALKLSAAMIIFLWVGLFLLRVLRWSSLRLPVLTSPMAVIRASCSGFLQDRPVSPTYITSVRRSKCRVILCC